MATDGADPVDPRALERIAIEVGEQILGTTVGGGYSYGLACAKFNGEITLRLLDGALAALRECGVARRDVTVAWVPGAFELPMMAHALTNRDDEVDAVIALGAVIRGETGHYDIVAGECARGLQEVQLMTGVPVILGVLTVENLDQAIARSRADETNKGREAALSAVEMVTALHSGSLAN
jgi:6,7-dimethyl-8-ribityllumazine synthase